MSIKLVWRLAVAGCLISFGNIELLMAADGVPFSKYSAIKDEIDRVAVFHGFYATCHDEWIGLQDDKTMKLLLGSERLKDIAIEREKDDILTFLESGGVSFSQLDELDKFYRAELQQAQKQVSVAEAMNRVSPSASIEGTCAYNMPAGIKMSNSDRLAPFKALLE